MNEGCRFLMYGNVDGIKVKLEEDTRGAFVVIKDTSIVCNAVLVGLKGMTARSNIRCRDDMHVVLVCSEIFHIPSKPTAILIYIRITRTHDPASLRRNYQGVV